MTQEMIALTMFAAMMLMLMTGQRVFGAIGAVAAIAALVHWGAGPGGTDIPFAAAMKLMGWYPLLTLPMFIFMGYILSESKIADDLYRMFHVWMGPVNGGLAIGTIGLMVLISAMNGLSVAGMAIGATIALPELLKRGYDKRMVTGVIQAGASLGILVPPSVVLVLYAMIARQPVGQLWLAGVVPGLMMAAMFILYIWVRCRIQPHLGPALPPEERNVPLGEKIELLAAGFLPIGLFLVMMVPFVNGWTSLVESSALGAVASMLAAAFKRHLTALRMSVAALVLILLAVLDSYGILTFATIRETVIGPLGKDGPIIGFAVLGVVLLVPFLLRILRDRWFRGVMETSIRQTLAVSCMFMFIILAALGFGAVFDGLGAVAAIEDLFTGKLGLDPWTILILMQLSFLVMGTFLDDTAMLVIVAPLYVPLVDQLGFDLIWYGVLYTITTQVAYMTPPFGYNLFLMRAMAPREITIRDIYISIFPFVLVMILALGIIMALPEIALWLPHEVYGIE